MPNTLLTPKVYANVMLKLVKNNLVMGRLVTTEFKNEFKKVGQTVYVKRPPRFSVRRGRIAQVQSIEVGETPVSLDYQAGVDIELTSVEATLTVDKLLRDETMNSQAATLAQEIDATIAQATIEFPNWVGTPGNRIDAPTELFAAPERLDEMAVPQSKRVGILTPNDYWGTAGSMANSFLYDNDINRTALQKAKLPIIGNVDYYMSQNVINLVTGTRVAAGASLVNGAGQVVTYLQVANNMQQTFNIDGMAAGATIKRGEVFTIAGVYAINPVSRMVMPWLAQFTVLADAVANGAGQAQLTIALPIIVDGPWATVSAAPADNAAVTWRGNPSTAYRQNAVFHKSAITMTFAKLIEPNSGKVGYATDKETGISIRYWKTSDGTNDTHMDRADVLFGVTNTDRALGTRVSGQ